ncbi:MAG: P-loop NTPase, partial [Acidimicrobiia bacterium]
MDLLAYLRILRRRWTIVLAVAVAGAAIGVGSALLDSKTTSTEGRTYYRASNVLFFDPSVASGTGSSFSNLSQLALLTVAGDVPKRVGTQLGEDSRTLTGQVLVTPNTGSGTLEITAAASTERESEQIADAFADALIASITAREQASFEQQRDRTVALLDEVQAEINELDGEIASAPLGSPPPVLKAQRDSLVNVYRLTYEQFQDLARSGPPTPSLSTLEAAEAVPISSSEYRARLRRGQIGENVVEPASGSESTTDDVAFASSSTAFDGPVSRGILGGVFGFLGGIGLALVAERLDRRLRTREEIEDAYGLPVLAGVPLLTSSEALAEIVVSYAEPLSRTAEAHRTVRSSLLLQQAADQPVRTPGDGHPGPVPDLSDAESAVPKLPLVVLVTSAIPGEGKSTTTANLAAVFAEAGASVLAVNCDFRRPSLHHLLGAPPEARRMLKTRIPGVKLIWGATADPHANPAKVIASQRQAIAAAREQFDVVVLDTAPVTTTNDAIEVMGSADLAVLVARPGLTTSDAAARVRTLLERIHAPVAGIVLIGDESVASDPYYYYSRESGQEPLARAPVDGTDVTHDAEDMATDAALEGDGAGVGAEPIDRVDGGKVSKKDRRRAKKEARRRRGSGPD